TRALSSTRFPSRRSSDLEGEREGEGEEEEEELLPDRSEPSLSLLLDLLAERDRRAGFLFFLLIFETEALDPPAFGGSSIMSFGRSEEHTSELQSRVDLVC